MTQITNEQLAADIRTLAHELNNTALTLAAVLRITGADLDQVRKVAREIMLEIHNAEAEPKQAPAPTAEEHIAQNFNAVGTPTHPAGAVFFGG